jgi:hypothetical protein
MPEGQIKQPMVFCDVCTQVPGSPMLFSEID